MARNRRSFLKAAGAAAAGGMLGLASAAKIGAAEVARVKLTLPWLPLGTYTYPFVAKKIGAWQQRPGIRRRLRSFNSIRSSKLSPSFHRLQHRDLIRIFNIAAHRDSHRNARHAHARAFKLLRKISSRGLAFDCRVRRQNDFVHVARIDAG